MAWHLSPSPSPSFPVCLSASLSFSLCRKQRFLMMFGLSTDVVYWHERLVEVHGKIAEETGQKPCTKVFVTFEKEASQRQCLKEMTTGEGETYDGGGIKEEGL